MQDAIHYPTLKTVLQVEKVLKDSEAVISKNELKRRLPTGIMHQTLNFILKYLEDSNKVYIGEKGISWLQSDNKELKKLLKNSVRVA